MKKQILAACLAALLAASLIACAGTPVDPPTESDASSSQTETQAATAHTTEQTQTTAVTDCTEPAGTESTEQCQCPAESTQTSIAQSTAQSTQASTAESQTDDEAPKYTRIMDENGHCLSVVTNDRAENIELWKTPDDPAIRLDIEENRDGTVGFSYFTDAEGWRLDWVDAADGTLLYRYDQEGYCETYPRMDGSDKARGKLTLFVQSGWFYISLTREADGSVTESEYSTPYPSLYDRIMDEWNTATRRFPVKTLPLTDKDTVPETPKYQTMAFDYPIAWGDEKDGSRIYALYPRFMAESDVPQPEDLYEACKTAQLFPYLRMSGVGRLYYSEQPLPAPSFETLVTYFGGMCGQLIDMDAAEYGDFSVRQMLQYLHDSEFPAFEWMEVSEEDTDAYTLFFGNWAISIHRVDEHHYDCVAMRHYWLDDFTMFYRSQDAMLIYPDGRMYY